jgi:hypothetical protein
MKKMEKNSLIPISQRGERAGKRQEEGEGRRQGRGRLGQAED